MTKRIEGVNVARALAIFGMITVNFKLVFGSVGSKFLIIITDFLEGKAAALFVLLAGVGMGLMFKSSALKNKLDFAQKRIIKRAIFLFIFGLAFSLVYPPDILQFYGIYMIISLFVIKMKRSVILIVASLFIFSFPILSLFLNYENGWDFDTLEYIDFWTVNGFFRKLFFNGFHPVVPWIAFMLVGIGVGKSNLNDNKVIRRLFYKGIGLIISVNLLSIVSVNLFSNYMTVEDVQYVFGVKPLPPWPFYMLNAIGFSITILSSSILISRKFKNNIVIRSLDETGKMAFTIYVLHIVLGIGIVELIFPNTIGNLSFEYSLLYAVCFTLVSVLFSVFWLKHKKHGPFEWLIRKLSD